MAKVHDRTSNSVLELMEKYFPAIRTKNYDTTCIDHPCGCREFIEFDDTPGYRSKDHWVNDENCMFNIAKDSDIEDDNVTFFENYADDTGDENYIDFPGFRD